jgi:hypothetical protein
MSTLGIFLGRVLVAWRHVRKPIETILKTSNLALQPPQPGFQIM